MKFNPSTTTFNIKNALYFANVSRLVYLGYSEIEEEAKQLQVGFKYFEKGNTQALILYDDDKVILAFRGTESQNLADWITDLQCRKVRYFYGKGKIHAGFERSLVDVWEYIYQALQEIKPQVMNRRIWLTGHSMGGALATLTPMWLQGSGLFQDYDMAGGYTFGSPRVGNEEFATEFTQLVGNKWYRIVNCSDFVARVPRRIVGYKHVGQLYYFDEDGKLYTPEHSQNLWGTFWDRIEMGIDAALKLELSVIENHNIANYIKNLKRS